MPSPAPDIDRILEAIRAEARARGSRGRVGLYSTQEALPPTVTVAIHGLERLPSEHVADYLALPLDVFIAVAYREILGREADTAGAAYYQRMLLRGKLTRVEVLGRLRFSPEGRVANHPVPGLLVAFALATCYRIPLLGAAAAATAWLLRLPPHFRDRSALEATALASGAWMKR